MRASGILSADDRLGCRVGMCAALVRHGARRPARDLRDLLSVDLRLALGGQEAVHLLGGVGQLRVAKAGQGAAVQHGTDEILVAFATPANSSNGCVSKP